MSGPVFYGRTLHGLELVAAEELSSRFGARIHATGHREIFFSGVAPDSLQHVGVLDDVFALCGEIRGLDHTRASLETLRRSAATEQVAAVREGLATAGRAAARSIEVVASFLGRRNYNRFDIEAAVGQPLAAALRMRLVTGREEAADAVLRVHLRDEAAVLAVRLFDVPLDRRGYKKVHHPGATPPQLGRAMSMVAQIEPGMRVLDPYCGTCTILIEAALLQPRASLHGSDISGDAVVAGRMNASAAGVALSLYQMSTLALGFPDRTFDRIITNMPWGRQVPHRGRPDQPWCELHRVLSVKGRCVALVHEAGGTHAGFERESERHVRVYGQSSWLVSLRAV